MKTKIYFLAALLGAVALSANAGARFGVTFQVPPPVVVPTRIVYVVPVRPAPVTVVRTVPPCPGVDYVRVPGYWAYHPGGRIWVPGAWCHRPAHIVSPHHRAGYHR
jgi:hypothetical protein